MNRDGTVRVLVCDDSLVAREMLATILTSDPSIEVVGQARDGLECVQMVETLRPDLVTMDIHMPRMDGLQATERIMAYHPTPIMVVSSSVHAEGMGLAFDALKLGALEVIAKPEPEQWADLERIGREIIRSAKILSRVHVITHIAGRRADIPHRIMASGDASARSIVAIGSSTGGPSALLDVLAPLPASLPVPVVIAQHIAEGFVPGLVEWLDGGCAVRVRVAEDGVALEAGTAYVAPTSGNLRVDGAFARIEPPADGQLYVPGVDVLFESVAATHGRGAVGVLLTGMGADGARGLGSIKASGGATVAQDEASCTVFGMPRAAIEAGAVERVLPLDEIAQAVIALTGAQVRA